MAIVNSVIAKHTSEEERNNTSIHPLWFPLEIVKWKHKIIIVQLIRKINLKISENWPLKSNIHTKCEASVECDSKLGKGEVIAVEPFSKTFELIRS